LIVIQDPFFESLIISHEISIVFVNDGVEFCLEAIRTTYFANVAFPGLAIFDDYFEVDTAVYFFDTFDKAFDLGQIIGVG
jgi:hypothetical protein